MTEALEPIFTPRAERGAGSAATAPAAELCLDLICPQCRGPLTTGADGAGCGACRLSFPCRDGIWRFLTPDRAEGFRRFTEDYERIRRAEGWGSADSAYYRALPFDDRTGRRAALWRIRAASYGALRRALLRPLATRLDRPLDILDLGSGNGWLSHRLAADGHRAIAVDLFTNDFDGLGCRVHYETPFVSVQADFDRLPFAGGQADLAIFNASLHYAADCAATLAEALRVLRREGRIVILDTPLYHDPGSGERMVAEREERYLTLYGTASSALRSEGYLTRGRLQELASALELDWSLIRPAGSWRQEARAWQARLLRRREPARIYLIAGRPRGGG